MEEQRTTFKLGRSIGLTLPKQWCEDNGITAKTPVLMMFFNHEEAIPQEEPMLVKPEDNINVEDIVKAKLGMTKNTYRSMSEKIMTEGYDCFKP